MTEELHELHEHAEHAREHPDLAPVTLTMAVLAVLVATVSLLGHRTHTEEVILQNKVTDQWAYYQAKNIRRHTDELFADLTTIVASKDAEAAAKLHEKYRAEADRYKDERKELDAKRPRTGKGCRPHSPQSRPFRPRRSLPGDRPGDHLDHPALRPPRLLAPRPADGNRRHCPSRFCLDRALTTVQELDSWISGHPRSSWDGRDGRRSRTRFININNVDMAAACKVKFIRESIRKSNPKATILETACRVSVTVPESIKGRRVRVVEDGPTLIHEILTAFTARRISLPRKVTKK